MSRLPPHLYGLALLLFSAPLVAQRQGASPLPPPAASSVASRPLDLNQATAAQLEALPGMGRNYAKRIIEGRPYTMKNQLVGRGILPQAAYDRIKDSIVAHRAPR